MPCKFLNRNYYRIFKSGWIITLQTLGFKIEYYFRVHSLFFFFSTFSFKLEIIPPDFYGVFRKFYTVYTQVTKSGLDAPCQLPEGPVLTSIKSLPRPHLFVSHMKRISSSRAKTMS